MSGPEPEGTSASTEPGGCQVSDVFDLLSRAHMMDLTHLLIREAEGPLRFNEIQDALELSPRTLSARLKSLTNAGLVVRRSYDEVPPRVEYEATPKALELGEIFSQIKDWTERHDLAPEPSAAAEATPNG